PMSLTREGTVALLQVIPPARLGMPAPEEAAASTRPLRFWALGGEAGVGAFAAGRVDALLGGTYVDWPRVGGAGIARASVRVDPVAGMFGLEVLHHEGLLAIAQNREAIAMSIDRAALAARMGLPAWVTTSRVVSPGLPGDSGQVGERWLDYDMENRHALAGPRIAAWVKLSGKPAHLRISMPAGPGSSLLTERLVIDLATIGITAEAVDEHAPADLKVVDVVARYQRNTWFFSQMNCAARPAACNPDADALVLRGQAAAGSDAQALFAQAERAYADANDYIPLGLPIRWALAAPSLAGFAVNGWAYHPLRPLAGRLP
ncbi:MAG TPA: ABC transporter substrate-binding protein, partial [Novosphingobium sp.]|nr:ABC transporter substrate-binding protein [Novosphingobium sp.]